MTVVDLDLGLDLEPAATATGRLTVSVCIPARNEAATVAGVAGPIVRSLLGDDGPVDEVLVVDDGSSDGTGAVAVAAGARVLRRSGPSGKGAAMAAAAAAATGDLVVFLDADVTNFGPHFVTRLLEPLQADPGIVLVKATYRRPGGDTGAGGGRVTELLARPLLRRFFPELAFLRQPLAGEVAVRREALEGLVFEPGYGVEIGMLIDVARRFGPESVAQVELGERAHRNRPLVELAGEADEVLAAVLDRVDASSETRGGHRPVRATS